MQFDLLVHNIGQLILPKANSRPLKGEEMKQLTIKENAAFAIKDEKIAWIGTNDEASHFQTLEKLNAQQKVVSPGLVDPHTHLVFGGSREKELALKQAGIPYLEILAKGGGILSTVEATRKATEEELYQKASFHLNRIISYGVTMMEAKSGYGLDSDTELKQLKVVKKLKESFPISIVSTFLGPHAIPPSYKGKEDEFLEDMVRLLDRIKKKTLQSLLIFFVKQVSLPRNNQSTFYKRQRKKGLA